MGLEGKSVEAEDLAEAESDGGKDVFLTLACPVVSSGSGKLCGSSGQDGGVEGRLTGEKESWRQLTLWI